LVVCSCLCDKRMEETPHFVELAKDDWWIYCQQFDFFIIQNLIEFRGLNEVNIATKLIYFGVDEVTIFCDVTIQFMQKHVPFVNNVDYMAHCTNLVVHNLSGLSLVSKIKSMFASI
jgi:hypothetical protein